VAAHYVYLYATKSGRVVYVGYGRRTQRSMTHPESGHRAFRTWLARNPHEIRIAGPYRDAQEAKAVEAAFISALTPEFNRASGAGPRFVPLGVPLDLAPRARLEPLTLERIGGRARGALLVYLAPGDLLPDGRRKFDPARPSDEDAVRNTERWWQIGRLQKQWEKEPRETPNLILGVHGRVGHRFIVAALRIDRALLGTTEFKDPRPRGRWQVPLVDRAALDEQRLRGRLVEDVTFGRLAHQLHIWVDREGVVRHPDT